jgi:hypothetical protein
MVDGVVPIGIRSSGKILRTCHAYIQWFAHISLEYRVSFFICDFRNLAGLVVL